MQAHNGIITGDLRVIGEIRGKLGSSVTIGGKTFNNTGNVTISLSDLGAQAAGDYLDLPGSNSMTGSIKFALPDTGEFRGITGASWSTDAWRVGGFYSASNETGLEIATADDGTEPIYVRQYSSTGFTSANIRRTLTLFDTSGNTSIPGDTAFGGHLTTTATTKTKDIGSTSARWKGVYSDTVDASTKVTVGSGTIMYNSATGCLEITA